MKFDLLIKNESFSVFPHRRDLSIFMYAGGADCNPRFDSERIFQGEIRIERLEILLGIRDVLEGDLAMGKSIHSVASYVSSIKRFISFVDKNNLFCEKETLEHCFMEYSEFLFERYNRNKSDLSQFTAHGYTIALSRIFGIILGTNNAIPLKNRTRLKPPKRSKKAMSKTEEKQSLEDVFIAGSFLSVLIKGLTKEKILGQLPISIPIRKGVVDGDKIEIALSSADDWLWNPKIKWTENQKWNSRQAFRCREPVKRVDGTNRWKFINIRILSEFVLFVASTGLNKEPARNLLKEPFKYESSGEYWIVKTYKNRKGGEFRFKIYKSYKSYFERYLKFINYFCPDSKWLFPIVGDEKKDKKISSYSTLRNLFDKHDVPWIPPKLLRNARVNWLLRRSGDEDLTSEMAQHTKEVMRNNYERPSQQRAMSEVIRYWKESDSIRKIELRESLVLGVCDGKPEVLEDKPSKIVNPNCKNPSGCLWCKKYRDVDSEDYVWSLVSFRHLKTIEASGIVTVDEVPSDLVVERLAQKIFWFKNSTRKRREWVEESELRVDEGNYHPSWSNIIGFLE